MEEVKATKRPKLCVGVSSDSPNKAAKRPKLSRGDSSNKVHGESIMKGLERLESRRRRLLVETEQIKSENYVNKTRRQIEILGQIAISEEEREDEDCDICSCLEYLESLRRELQDQQCAVQGAMEIAEFMADSGLIREYRLEKIMARDAFNECLDDPVFFYEEELEYLRTNSIDPNDYLRTNLTDSNH